MNPINNGPTYTITRREGYSVINDGRSDWTLRAAQDEVDLGHQMGSLSQNFSIKMLADHAEIKRESIGCFGSFADGPVENRPYDKPLLPEQYQKFGLQVASELSGIPLNILECAAFPETC